MRPRIWLRRTELWIGPVGIFWGKPWGIELPNGRFFGV